MNEERVMEMERNFQAFEGLLAGLIQKGEGGFALMSGGRLIETYPRPVEALIEGNRRFGEGNFSVQRIIDRPMDLGFLSYASSERETC